MLRQTRIKNGIAAALTRAAILITVSAVSVFGVSCASIPDRLAVRASSANEITVSLPFVSLDTRQGIECASYGSKNAYQAQARVCGIAVKQVTVNVYDDELRLYPGGQTFGIRMNTRGVVVVGISEVQTEQERCSPALTAGLQVSDVITEIGGKAIDSVDTVTGSIAECGGKDLKLTVERQGQRIELTLQPVKSADDGFWRAGLWIRDGTAGIGTVTYVNPEDMSFGGLGHGVCDADTGELMPLGSGNVFSVTVSGIVRGEGGCPGEIKGYFNAGKTGVLTSNGNTGVYGVFAGLPEPKPESVAIALHDEIENGSAVIRCALDESEIKEYSVEIEKLSGESDEKNMIVHVTDPALLEKTGGIIQGMSGSPILQNGRLIGAVTHVLINDPSSGYGIYIENMLEHAA